MKNNSILMGGKEIKLNGINWFGMNTPTRTVHSLWQAPLDDYIAVLTKYQFNAVRLTLSANVMLNLHKLGLKDEGAVSKNPEMAGMTVGQHLDDLVARLEKAGILVMFNLHRMNGNKDGSEENAIDIGPLWYTEEYPEEKIIEAWVTLTKRYVNAPNVFAMDIKNEPHGATWGDGNPKTDWRMFCQKIGNIIHEINPKVLIGCAGITSPGGRWSDSVGDAETKPVILKLANKVFYTPHFYILTQTEAEMSAYLDKCVGNLAKNVGSVIVGEWGWDENDVNDVKWAEQYMAYMKKAGLTNQFYWTLNENAGMNHGILVEGGVKVKEEKVAALKTLQGEGLPISFG